MRNLVIVIALVCPSAALAECIVPGSVCEEFRKAERVFLGEAIAVRLEPAPNLSEWKWPRVVTFRVLEAFKGADAREIVMTMTVGVESPRFIAGQIRVVYATRSPTQHRWFAGCSRADYFPAADEANALRALASGAAGAAVEGRIESAPGVNDSRDAPGSDPGITLVATSELETVTLAVSNSRFLMWLPPGRYRVRLESIRWTARGFDLEVVPSVGCVLAPLVTVNPRAGR